MLLPNLSYVVKAQINPSSWPVRDADIWSQVALLFNLLVFFLIHTGSILKYLSQDMSFFCQIILYLYFICLISLAKSQNDFSFFHYASNLAFDHKIWWLDIKSDDWTTLKNWRLAGDFPWCSIILKVHVHKFSNMH